MYEEPIVYLLSGIDTNIYTNEVKKKMAKILALD